MTQRLPMEASLAQQNSSGPTCLGLSLQRSNQGARQLLCNVPGWFQIEGNVIFKANNVEVSFRGDLKPSGAEQFGERDAVSCSASHQLTASTGYDK